jgi:polyketide biosynthesis acyl carrier protein
VDLGSWRSEESSAEATLNRDVILGIILDKIRVVAPDLPLHFELGPGDSMSELGLDSMERHEVIVLTLDAINLDLPLVQLHGPRSIGELADRLYAKLPA